jgi:hypothetical protein
MGKNGHKAGSKTETKAGKTGFWFKAKSVKIKVKLILGGT